MGAQYFVGMRDDPAALPSAPGSTFRWATVVNPDPLSIRLDGESRPLDARPDTLVRVGVGDRVWTQLHGRSVVVVGAATATYSTWVPASNLNSEWDFTFAEYRVINSFFAEARFHFSRAVGAGPISVPVSGNIANRTLCTIPADVAPTAYSTSLTSNSTGRVAVGQMSSGGEVHLAAVAGSSEDIAEGETLTLSGMWVIQ